MPVYDTSIRVAHTPENLYDLVSDIGRYPEFIKWIRSMRVSGQREAGGVRHSLGEARVGFRGFTENFATTVAADPQVLTIDADLVRGPFRRLHNRWRFEPAPGGTKIAFHIDYEFSNPVLRMLARHNFRFAVDRIMAAFIAEADRRYRRVTPLH